MVAVDHAVKAKVLLDPIAASATVSMRQCRVLGDTRTLLAGAGQVGGKPNQLAGNTVFDQFPHCRRHGSATNQNPQAMARNCVGNPLPLAMGGARGHGMISGASGEPRPLHPRRLRSVCARLQRAARLHYKMINQQMRQHSTNKCRLTTTTHTPRV